MLSVKQIRLLDSLRANSRKTLSQLAIETEMAASTVVKEMSRLKKKGVVKRYSIQLNYELIGCSLMHFVIKPRKNKKIKELLKHECINSAYKLSKTNLYLKCVFRTPAEAWNFYEKIIINYSVERIQIIETIKEEQALCNNFHIT
jgi:DNA-binding Lrp family transcriptional regulator